MTVEKDQTLVTIPSNPADRKKIRDVLEDISNVMLKVESERDYISEALENLSKEFNLPKKYVRKMARVFHAQTLAQELAEMSDFQTLYEAIIEEKSKQLT